MKKEVVRDERKNRKKDNDCQVSDKFKKTKRTESINGISSLCVCTLQEEVEVCLITYYRA